MALILADVGKKRLSDGRFYISNKDFLCVDSLGDWGSFQRTVQQREWERRGGDR